MVEDIFFDIFVIIVKTGEKIGSYKQYVQFFFFYYNIIKIKI